MTEKKKAFIKSFTDSDPEMREIASQYYDNTYIDEDDDEDEDEIELYREKLDDIIDTIDEAISDLEDEDEDEQEVDHPLLQKHEYFDMALAFILGEDPKSIVLEWEDNTSKVIDKLLAFDERMFNLHIDNMSVHHENANEYTNADFPIILREYFDF